MYGTVKRTWTIKNGKPAINDPLAKEYLLQITHHELWLLNGLFDLWATYLMPYVEQVDPIASQYDEKRLRPIQQRIHALVEMYPFDRQETPGDHPIGEMRLSGEQWNRLRQLVETGQKNLGHQPHLSLESKHYLVYAYQRLAIKLQKLKGTNAK